MIKSIKVQKIGIAILSILLSIPGKALAKDPTIYSIAQDSEYGIVVFVNSSCGACNRQLNVLKPFIHKTRWKPYKIINLDQKSNQNPEIYNDYVACAKRYGVQKVPEIWIIKKKENIHTRVGFGFTPIYQLEHSIISTVKRWENG